MLEISTLKTDQEKAENGVWCQFDEGVELLIANYNNNEFQNAMQKAVKDIPAHRRNDTKLINPINKRVMAKTVLLGWKGLADKGAELPYTEKNALELLTQSNAIFNFVFEKANDLELFRKEIEKEEAEAATVFPAVES